MKILKTIVCIILSLFGFLITIVGISTLLDKKSNYISGIIAIALFGLLPLFIGLYFLLKGKFNTISSKNMTIDTFNEKKIQPVTNLEPSEKTSGTIGRKDKIKKESNTENFRKVIQVFKKIFKIIYMIIKFPFIVLAIIFGLIKYCDNCKSFKAKKIKEEYLYSRWKYETKKGEKDKRHKEENNPETMVYKRFFKCNNCEHEWNDEVSR